MGRDTALSWAADARAARERLRDDLAAGRTDLATVLDLARRDDLTGSVKLLWVLESLPGARKVQTRRTLAELGLSGSERIGVLEPADRDRVLTRFAPEPPARAAAALPPGTMVLVVSGPGGVGKGTIVQRLLERDDRLWLSRSWTTRARRHGESPDAYHFATRDEFERRVTAGGFLEWVEFLDYLQGSPVPEPPPGRDVLFEIDVQGAANIRALYPDAVLVFIDAPDRATQEQRLRGRGDSEDRIRQRLDRADEEARLAAQLDMVHVVNDDLDRAVEVVAGLLARHRSS